ncbi:LysE family translocator [Vibrio sp. S4M6]|uniref:LysE family translocator n=1 Tax=Vibrio sinus TaxID=2946865 RepID=UPI00202A3B59|nr:LysE family translocator [Vibrio sinus]MCL9783267.1 LysE family translocator [Vibrio sinus]
MFVSTITPGPNVVMVTASGANFGIKRTLPHLFGIAVGCYIIMVLEALGINQLFAEFPSIPLLIKIVGTLYLTWLGLKLFRKGKPEKQTSRSRPLYLRESVLLQFLNPKGWILTLTVMSGYTIQGNDYWLSVLIVSSIYAWSGTFTSGVWMVLGSQVAKVMRDEKHWRLFNGTMGLLTMACAVMLWTGI